MNETIRVIQALKTVRNFSERPIAPTELACILQASVQAATASARQTYSIIVVEDKEVMRKIGYVASHMLVFCVDFNRVIDTANYLGYQYGPGLGEADFVTGSTDTLLAAQTAAIAAQSLGIASFFSNCLQRGDMRRIYQLLNLPERYCFPLVALLLGYAAEPDKAGEKGRIAGPGVIHYQQYQRVTASEIEDIVAAYDQPDKHFLTLIADWQKRGYPHYLDCFYESWCGYRRQGAAVTTAPANPYAQVAAMLRRSGFWAEEPGATRESL